jgi:hypothetical protein
MPVRCDPATGLTPQQEAFAQALASGADQSGAYRTAFRRSRGWRPKSVWEHASRLAANGKVQARVDALGAIARAEAERSLKFGLPEAFAMADEAFECGRQFEQAGAMVAAAHLKAKIAGLVVNTHEIRKNPIDGLSPELVRELEKALSIALEHKPGSEHSPKQVPVAIEHNE